MQTTKLLELFKKTIFKKKYYFSTKNNNNINLFENNSITIAIISQQPRLL